MVNSILGILELLILVTFSNLIQMTLAAASSSVNLSDGTIKDANLSDNCILEIAIRKASDELSDDRSHSKFIKGRDRDRSGRETRSEYVQYVDSYAVIDI